MLHSLTSLIIGFATLCFLVGASIAMKADSAVLYDNPERMISFDELQYLNSEKLLEILKETSLLTIVKDLDNPLVGYDETIKNWPKKDDITYLLSLADSKEECGVIWYVGFSVYPNPGEEKTTIGATAIYLLDAIRRKEFILRPSYYYPENKEEILNWARKEEKSLENEK